VEWAIFWKEHMSGAWLPVLQAVEPVDVDKPALSVMHGQCDARPTVTYFPSLC